MFRPLMLFTDASPSATLISKYDATAGPDVPLSVQVYQPPPSDVMEMDVATDAPTLLVEPTTPEFKLHQPVKAFAV